MRDRLIKLLKEAECASADCINCEYGVEEDCKYNRAAAYLLSNGVIAPPCKEGDMVYVIGKRKDPFGITSHSVINKSTFRLDMLEAYGKTVFLTSEEAEEAIRGEPKNEKV